MENKDLYVVYENYTGEVVLMGVPYTQVQKFISVAAQEMNYGLYRYWQHDDETFYDCGPRTYVVRKFNN